MTKTKRLSHSKRRQLKHRIRAKRPWYKKLSLHPLAIISCLVAGFILISLTAQSLAADVNISAIIHAPAIASPAVIEIVAPAGNPGAQVAATSANSEQTAIHESTDKVILSGECPSDSHLEIQRNNIFAGATPCVGQTFNIEIQLVGGMNEVVARVFNITDDEGPVSNPVFLDFKAPTTPGVPAPTTPTTPFLTSSDFKYLGFYTHQQGSWKILINGGISPYTINIEWGDGLSDQIKRPNSDSFEATHTYNKPSSKDGYVITINAKDAAGKTAVFQMMSIISDRGSHNAALVTIANNRQTPGFFTLIKRWLSLEWPLYGIIALIMTSFWLGEREEYHKLAKRLRTRPAKV